MPGRIRAAAAGAAVDGRIATSPRAFAQGTYRHALFDLLLGRLAA